MCQDETVVQVEPKKITPEDEAKALKKKWKDKVCSDEIIDKDKKECEKAQSSAQKVAATLFTIATLASLM